MRSVLGCVALILGLVVWSLVGEAPTALMGFTEVHGLTEDRFATAFPLFAGYVCLILGMFLGVLARALLQMRDAGQEFVEMRPFLKASWKRVDLWLSFVASPVVYGGISSADLSIPQYCYFALQTGFSSYVAIRALVEGSTAKKAA